MESQYLISENELPYLAIEQSEVASDSSTNSSIYVIPVRNVTYQSHATHTLLPEDLLQYYPTGSLRRGRGKKGYHDKA